MLRKFYMGLASATLIGYSAMSLLGWELASPSREQVPNSIRSSPGGYRSFHFWHTGFHGGK
jgi:hypothetical protein